MNIKRYAFAGGTFACALGIGFFMQQSEASVLGAEAAPVQTPVALSTPTPDSAPQALVLKTTSALPQLSPITGIQTAASSSKVETEADDVDIQLAELDASDAQEAPQKLSDAVDIAEGCEIGMTGIDDRAAMVKVSLSAPCAATQIATIHHEGMMFSVALDEEGQAEFLLPVLTENALVIAALEGGEGAVLTHQVPSLGTYDRVVVQWKGDIGVELHAREWGSEYGDAGHVWYGAPRDAGAISYQVGFLTRLGVVDSDSALVADVYTFPTTMSDGGGMIELSVETEINAINCDQEITAQTIQISPFAERVAHDLELALPECDAVGDFVVLAMPVQDIQLASN